ncbi:MAG: hypothetical protein CM15mP102_13470 [Flavobacteriales bacterium]|nr:MAG: hypothetical protein CM15mP102_13470 [Flavobacteriales bacterium]
MKSSKKYKLIFIQLGSGLSLSGIDFLEVGYVMPVNKPSAMMLIGKWC